MIYVVIAIVIVVALAVGGALVYRNNRKQAEALVEKSKVTVQTVQAYANQVVADVKSSASEIKKS